MNVAAEASSFRDQLVNEHKERQKRIMQAVIRQQAPKAAPVLTIVKYVEPYTRPMWRRYELYFDAHVKAYQWCRAERMANKARTHLKDRCIELGISYELVTGETRRRHVVAVRQLIMWELYTLFALSLPAIGRLFGWRDHTTVLHAVRKIEKQRAST